MASALIAAGLFASAAASATQQQEPVNVPKVIRKSGGVLQSSAVKRVEPTYPPLAKAAHLSGSVLVELIIDETGKVVSATAISGHPLLKDAAVQAALAWEFQPTTLQGVPVRVIGTITFNFQMGDSDEGPSIEVAEKMVQEHPDSARAQYDLAMAYARHSRLPDAIQSLRDAIRVDPKFEIAYRTLGKYLMQPETGSEAIDMLKEAIRLDPTDKEAHFLLLGIYRSLKRNDDAIDLLKQTMTDDPTSADPYIALASVYTTMEKYDQAEEALKQGLQVEPNRAAAYVALGELYTRQGRATDAINTLRRATHASPGYARAHFALGIAYLKSGDRNSAMGEYNALKQIGPEMAADLLNEINK
jgi:TonB family protein